MTSQDLNPKDPYNSYMVSASAGTGKTYQLTRRFISLVGAGADPTQILALTFTIKAAREMRERITRLAAQLRTNTSAQREFSRDLNKFYSYANKIAQHKLPVPLAPEEVGKKIISSIQRLRITTIDSLFYDCIQKFPTESNLDNKITLPLRIISSHDSSQMNKASWIEVFKQSLIANDIKKLTSAFIALYKEQGVLAAERQVVSLSRNSTLIWLRHREGRSGICEHYLKPNNYHWKETINDWYALADVHTKKDEVLLAIQQQNISMLQQLRVITKDLKVSGSTYRGKKREQLVTNIENIEQYLQAADNIERIKQLNVLSKALNTLYKVWHKERQKIKIRNKQLEFSDLALGAYHLFHGEDGAGVRWLLHRSIHHLLLDEFQDTSDLQWAVIQPLVDEIISGSGSNEDKILPGTVFIVGDHKQSIYGFREANPKVMKLAGEKITTYGHKKIKLNTNYRSTKLLLDVVNSTFCNEKDFESHQASNTIPNCGRIVVIPIEKTIVSASNEDKLPRQIEAEAVALEIYNIITGKIKTPIWCPKQQQFRHPQPKDCCVLYRDATHVNTIEKALSELELPYKREENGGFFAQQLIKDIICVLKLWILPSDHTSLLQCLTSPIINVKASSLQKAIIASINRSLFKKTQAICDFLSTDYPAIKTLQEIISLPQQSLLTCLYTVIEKLSFADKFVKEANINDKQIKSNITRLIELSLQITQDHKTTLSEGVIALEELSLHDEQTVAQANANSITLMTIHKAKGLEFPIVTLVDTGKPWGKLDDYWLKTNDGVYYLATQKQQPRCDNNFSKLIQDKGNELHDEAKRLLYVAMTRASQYLIISGHYTNNDSRKGFLSKLISVIQNMPQAKQRLQDSWEVDNTYNVSITLTKKTSSEQTTYQHKIPQPRKWQPKRLVYPAEFVRMEAQSISRDHELSALCGSFVHYALENVIASGSTDFAAYWQQIVLNAPLVKSFDPKRLTALYNLYHDELWQNINSALWQHIIKSARKCQTELPVLAHLDNNIIRGQIDLVAHHIEHIEVIDFKTSWPQQGINLQEFAHKRGYLRQLECYVQVIKKLYPNIRVHGKLWFTRNVVVLPLTVSGDNCIKN